MHSNLIELNSRYLPKRKETRHLSSSTLAKPVERLLQSYGQARCSAEYILG
jgi:hypothetical protein